MLQLTQLIGFGSGGGGTDVTPNGIDFVDISDSGFTASAGTNVVTISGIDTTITLRLTLTVAMASGRVVYVYRDGFLATSGSSGTTIDVTITNGQTLQYFFTNSQNLTTWSGTATVTNESDLSAVLDTFTYTLQDTGTAVGVGGVGGPIP
ncbi:MAG: hypothetical protein ABL996_26695 [Micropepsaceae bacterium]